MFGRKCRCQAVEATPGSELDRALVEATTCFRGVQMHRSDKFPILGVPPHTVRTPSIQVAFLRFPIWAVLVGHALSKETEGFTFQSQKSF